VDCYRDLAILYDDMMEDVDYDRWSEGILHHLRGRKTVADVACGTGALTLRLARAGCRVTGIDLSADMLMVAQEKARKARLKVPFVCQDARKLALMRPAEAVTMCCDGVNYLISPEDVAACFQRVYAALKPGGLFLFDVSSPYKLEQQLGSQFYGMTKEDVCYLWKNTFDPRRRLVTMDITFFVREQGDFYRRFDEAHVQRAHTPEELTAALANAGFRRIRCMGDLLTEEAPAPHCQRLYFTAEKE